jgi:hypothetical protein
LLCGTKSHRAADPSKTGVFFCAGKSACDSLQPLADVCCVVLCVTFRRWSVRVRLPVQNPHR